MNLKMKISYILFDLDNTLYPADSGLFSEIDKRMINFVSRYFNISIEEAKQLRARLSRKYGTTLSGLIKEYGFKNIEEYLHEVHPQEVEQYIRKDDKLSDFFEKLTIKRSILTNSPKEHAERVLNVLGLTNQFEYIFDIRLNNLMGKPNRDVYLKVLDKIKKKPDQVLFVDDLPTYLLPFRELGGHILLIDRYNRYDESIDIPIIHKLNEIFDYL